MKTGKITFAQAIAGEFSEYIELNASDKRSQDIIKKTIGESSSSKSLFGDEYKLIIMDEVDGIHGTNDRGGVRAIGEIIKTSKHPLILIANDFYSKRLQSIKPKCQVIKMGKIRGPTINKMLKNIAKKEGIEYDKEALKLLSKKANGDIRSAINTFQAIADTSHELTMEDVETVTTKDDRSTIIDGVMATLKSKNPKHVKDALRVDEEPTLVMEYIAENVAREYTNKNELKKAYESLSNADLYFGRAQRSRNYGYWKYATDFMGIGVSSAKRETYKKFTPIKSPTVFTLMGRNRGKRNLRDGIAEKMSEKMHISNSVAISMFPYLEIMFQNDELAWEISDFLDLEKDEIKRFRKKVIPKKVINKMEKQKEEMRIEERDKRAAELQSQMFEGIPQEETVEKENIRDEVELISKEPEVKKEQEKDDIDSIIKDPEVEEELMAEEIIKEEVEEKSAEKKNKQASLFDF